MTPAMRISAVGTLRRAWRHLKPATALPPGHISVWLLVRSQVLPNWKLPGRWPQYSMSSDPLHGTAAAGQQEQTSSQVEHYWRAGQQGPTPASVVVQGMAAAAACALANTCASRVQGRSAAAAAAATCTPPAVHEGVHLLLAPHCPHLLQYMSTLLTKASLYGP